MMLTDTQRELVAAGVDRPAAPRPDSPLARLLAASGEARELHRDLCRQRDALAGLPRHRVPDGFARTVLARLPATVPASARPVGQRVAWGQFLPYAAAASIVLMIGVGSLWMNSRPQTDPNQLVFNLTVLPEERATIAEIGTPAPGRVEEQPHPDTDPGAPDSRVAVGPPEIAPAPRPRSPVTPTYIGAAVLMPPDPLDVVEARLPLFLSAAEFDRPDILARLSEELGRESAFRLDLFCTDRNHALGHLLAAAKGAGLTTSIDSTAANRRKRGFPTEWVFYTEALDDRQITGLLGRLARQVRNTGPTDVGITGHLFPARPSDQKHLRNLFGVDVGLWKRPAEPTPPTGPGASVSAGTLDELTAALRSNGPAKPAIVVVDQPVIGRTNPFASAEITRYLRDRGDREPGTVPLMILIRSASE